MGHRNVSVAIIYTEDGKLLFQDRDGIAKFGEKYDFFGGGIEEGETPKDAILRELKEELDFDFSDVKTFKTYEYTIDEKNSRTFNVFIIKVPTLDKIKVLEGKGAKTFTYKEALKQKLFPGDQVILKEFGKENGFLKN
ncbi:MAG: NUDIX domain-containing protein [Nanoarchaeota archaeon]